MLDKQKVICIMGPTASGKTNLAIDLINKIPAEIVSVDSAMIYKGMNIGTAKPTAEELAEAPHRLIDICDPLESYSAADFCDDAVREIEDIFSQGKTPLLVGGTMLYFKALQEGLSILPAADKSIRQALLKEAESEGWDTLHEELKKVDPESAKRIHPNDPQRMLRALEVHRITGKSLTKLQAENSRTSTPYEFINFALIPDSRDLLRERIAERFELMLQQGFVEEVEKLYYRGDLHLELPSMRCVGYRQAWQYLAGDLDFETMKEKAIIATRQLAKRQLTWLRSWEDKVTLKAEKVSVLNVLKKIA